MKNQYLQFSFLPGSISMAFLGSIVLFLSSCSPAFYTPNEAYMMGISEKGDVKVAGDGPVSNGDIRHTFDSFIDWEFCEIIDNKVKLATFLNTLVQKLYAICDQNLEKIGIIGIA